MNTINIFISQPMSGISEDEVNVKFKLACDDASMIMLNTHKEKIDQICFLTTYYDKEGKEAINYKFPKIYRLGHALMKLANTDYIYFVDGWRDKRGCIIEYIVAKLFKVPIINESNVPVDINRKIYEED